jgi:branched-chain amino acid transport system substrate-binding protein
MTQTNTPQSNAPIQKARSAWRYLFLLIFLVPVAQPYFNQVINWLKFDRSQLSTGEKILIAESATPEKQQGVKELHARRFNQARKAFEESLQKVPNDPETRIYLNNATIADNSITVAVSVPISSNLNVAQEILRGVAQAQTEVNHRGGINGRTLQILIADDANDPDRAQQIAQQLSQDQKVIAVVGHNASNASLAAAPIYQQAQLVMISPTSSTNQLMSVGDYIFRTIPSNYLMGDILAEHVITIDKKLKIGTCTDQNAPDNLAYKDAFLEALLNRGGEHIAIDCDFADPSFNPTTVLQKAQEKGVQGILLTPHIDRLDGAIALIQKNQGQIALYSSSTLYTFKTLEQGKSSVVGLTLPTVWHPQQANAKAFANHAQKLWNGAVNWRTATAYDATMAIATGLTQGQTRQTLQAALRNPDFQAMGAGDPIRFLASGDRQIKPVLLQIKANAGNYEFSLVTPKMNNNNPSPRSPESETTNSPEPQN